MQEDSGDIDPDNVDCLVAFQVPQLLVIQCVCAPSLLLWKEVYSPEPVVLAKYLRFLFSRLVFLRPFVHVVVLKSEGG